MPLQDGINKQGYRETVAGLSATLAGQATDVSTQRGLYWLSQTKIALEVTVAFNALADGGLRIRILEYMTTASASTEPTPGQEGTVALSAGNTVRQTFHFTVRSLYYQVELFNLDSAAGRDAGSIVVQVIEMPEGEEGWDGQVNTHTQYWDGNAWQPQLILAWETGGNLDQITAAVEIMDDWDESDRAKVNLIVGQAGIAAGAGAVGVTVPRMTLASDDPAVVALQIIDDWDESDRAKVNLIVGQAGIAAGAGAVGVTVPRVTLASDDPAVTALQIMDDWDESNRAMVNLIVGQAGIAAGAGAVGVTVPRVTLASDDPAVTSLAIMDDWDESNRAMVNLIVGQAGVSANTGVMDVTTQRVTLATDDPAVIALQLLDDAIKTDDAAFTPATDKVSMIGAEFDDATPDSVDEGDAGAVRMSAFRSLHTLVRDAGGNERGANVTAANELNVLESNSGAIETAVEIMDDWDESDRAKVNLIVGQAGIAAGAGAVGVTVPRMTLASDDPAVTALEIIDDWDESDRAKVNLIVGQAGIAAGAGAVGVTVPRMTLASDDPAVVALQIMDDWDEDDRAKVNPERDIAIDEMDATTGWAVANDATINLATTASHITGTAALEFDKVDGSGFTEAYIEKTLSSLELEHFEAHTVIEFAVYLSSLTDVAYVFVRLGDDDGNYNEYRVIDDNITAGVWNSVAIPASQAEYPVTGTGIDASDVDYVAVGVSFDAENDALADIAFDRIHIHSSLHTFATLGAEVSTVISTANVNVQKIGNQVINRGAGAVALGTQRITLASDDPAVTALQIIDDWDETDRAKVNLIAGQVGVQGNEGVITALTQRVSLATDDDAVVSLGIIDDWDETDRAAVNLIAGQVGVQGAEGTINALTQRVTLATDDDAVASLGIIDDWDEANRAMVNPIVGQAGVQGNEGVITALTQRVTLATDDVAATDLTSVKNAVEIMDDWDETDRAAVNLIAGQVGVQGAEGVITALTQRVTLATDDDAVTSLGIIDDWDETDRAAVNLIAGQVGVQGGAGAVSALTQRVILATDDPAVTALNKIDGMSTLTDAVETALTQVAKVVAAVATPEAIAGAGTLFRRATIYATKAARTANVGIIYLGVTAGNDTQPIPLNPGDIFTIEAPPGEKYDFDNWFVDVLNAGDGVIAIYS